MAAVAAPLGLTAAPRIRADAPPEASYVVRLVRTAPPAFVVNAIWPSGSRLEMDTTRPGDLPELLDRGWPVLVTRLEVTDAAGRALEVVPEGEAGWRLSHPTVGAVFAEYEVDTRLLAENGWPAPREAAFVANDVVSVVGRALFLTTDRTQASRVRFDLPAGWRAYAPWDAKVDAPGATFQVTSAERLRENLIVFTQSTPTIVQADGFRLIVVALGSWRPLESELRRVARAHARRFVRLMGFKGRETYVAILLPLRERGAESYRQSMALTFDEEPTRANEASWANLIGHEIFHYWNGWRLRGADYPQSQWFQEGFTEYVANVSTVAAGLMTPTEFRDKLATHVVNYRRLATSLESPGNKKGPPLYSAGALVALNWDVAIRQSTGGARGLGDFLRSVWRRSAEGNATYGRQELLWALEGVSDRDWASFYDTHIRGTAPMPLEMTFADIGLRLTEPNPGQALLVADPMASAEAQRRWQLLVRGN